MYLKKGIISILCLSALALCGCEQDSDYAKIKKSGVIVFGMPIEYAPYSYQKNGKASGYDVECAKAVASKIGFKAKFKFMKNSELVKALDDGKVDAVPNQQYISFKVDKQKDEKPDYCFSHAYKYSRLVCIVRKGTTDIKHFDDQRDKKIAMAPGDFYEDSVLDDGGVIVRSTSFEDAMKKVQAKNAYSTMNDLWAFQYYRRHHKDCTLKGAVVSANVYGMTFMTKGTDETLADKMSDAVDSLRDRGDLADISVRYFGQDIAAKI